MINRTTLKPQKAMHLHDDLAKKNPKSNNQVYMVTEKLDGWYGYLENDDTCVRSGANRHIPSMEVLSKEILQLWRDNDVPEGRLIFEIYTEDVPFHIQNGEYNRKYEQHTECKFMVHDFIDSTDQDEPEIAIVRREIAEYVVRKINHPRLKMIPILNAYAYTTDIKVEAKKVWNAGGEGTIGVARNSFYEFSTGTPKRNANIIKVKEELTLDLLCVGLQKGEGKYADTTGALVVIDKNGVKNTISGMTDEQRDCWYNDPTLVIGNVIEVKAMKRLKDGSLREGRFKAIRYNKSKCDID